MSNISKIAHDYPIIHITNSINFFSKNIPRAKHKIYIKVMNLALIQDLSAESDLRSMLAQDKRYEIVNTLDEADRSVEIRVMFVSPISDETIDKISKYWAYRSVTDNNVVNNAEDLSNNQASFVMDDIGIGVAVGNSKTSPQASYSRQKNDLLDSIGKQDVIAGGALGGSIAGIVGLSPALISVSAIAGAGVGGILERLTAIRVDIAVVEIIVKEKVSLVDKDMRRTKYKNISSLSKNTVSEVYIERSSDADTTIEHSARLSVVSKSIAVAPSKINKLTSEAIVNIVGEILR